jgi:hypothetical protein
MEEDDKSTVGYQYPWMATGRIDIISLVVWAYHIQRVHKSDILAGMDKAELNAAGYITESSGVSTMFSSGAAKYGTRIDNSKQSGTAVHPIAEEIHSFVMTLSFDIRSTVIYFAEADTRPDPCLNTVPRIGAVEFDDHRSCAISERTYESDRFGRRYAVHYTPIHISNTFDEIAHQRERYMNWHVAMDLLFEKIKSDEFEILPPDIVPAPWISGEHGVGIKWGEQANFEKVEFLY